MPALSRSPRYYRRSDSNIAACERILGKPLLLEERQSVALMVLSIMKHEQKQWYRDQAKKKSFGRVG